MDAEMRAWLEGTGPVPPELVAVADEVRTRLPNAVSDADAALIIAYSAVSATDLVARLGAGEAHSPLLGALRMIAANLAREELATARRGDGNAPGR